MRSSNPRRARISRPSRVLLVAVLVAGVGSGPAAAAAQTRDAGAREPRAWRHLSMEDVEVDLGRFRPVRARYVQTMYDLEGRETVDASSLVTIDVDRAVHSGPWDGTAPIELDPFREPGLEIWWRIQNPLYRAFDRVLTDRRLSLVHRVMPGGFRGLRIGVVEADTVTWIDASPREPGEPIPVERTPTPGGSVNVLTIPYVLAGMDLEAGDRFTLPGYEMIGGPGGRGVAFRVGFWVRSVRDATIDGRSVRVAEVYVKRVPGTEAGGAPDFTVPGERMTRQLIAPDPPYLLGRADLVIDGEGRPRFVREHLGLAAWADLPLPVGENAREELWDLDVQAAEFRLRPDRTPAILVPLRPGK